MRTTRKLAVIFGLAILTHGGVASAAEDQLRVDVNLINEARATQAEVVAAQAQAWQIYERMGVEVVWSKATSLSIKLIATSRSNHPINAMGFAIKGGTLAYVFVDRLAYFSQSHGIPFDRVLGHAIAHELGHLLMPHRKHGLTGLMRSDWGRIHELTILRSSTAGLSFVDEEAAILRENVIRMRRRE